MSSSKFTHSFSITFNWCHGYPQFYCFAIKMFDNAANTIVYDASDGVFSDLYDASTVVASHLQQSDTNQIADQQAVIQLRSIHYDGGENNNIAIKFYNYSSTFVTIRWIDHKGQYNPSHTWILAPNEELNQQTAAGHIFVLSISNGSDESVLGAFRPKRTLPSGTYHSVQVHDGESSDYILEVILSHRYDALVVSSFWLNRNIVMKQTRQDATKTLNILHRIVSNVIQDRSNETFRKLRLSNDTVKKYICNWATMEYLRVLGFQKKMLANDQGREGEEEYLIVEDIPDDTTLALYVRGLALIEILQSRCQPGFVADLAPPTPWEIPIQTNDNGSGNSRRGRGGGGGRWGTAGSTNMMNPDDRWARVERARNFRRRAGPRPSPGKLHLIEVDGEGLDRTIILFYIIGIGPVSSSIS